MSEGIIIVQPAIIEYRIPFFNLLADAYGDELRVFGGDNSREHSVRSAPRAEPWVQIVPNCWVMGRRLLIQRKVLFAAVRAERCVLTLNPRILSTWSILVIRRVLRRRTVLWGHLNSRSGKHTPFAIRKLQMALSDGLIFYTNTEVQAYKDDGGKKLVVGLGNSCVSLKDCVLRSTSVPSMRRQFLFVGRIDRSKKIPLLLKAFRMLINEGENARLIIVGGGEEMESLKTQYAKLVSDGSLLFTGWIWDRNKLKTLYEESLFSVLPSYVGLSVIQTFAHGVPLVYPRNENHSPEVEACVPEENSITFEADDPVSLCAALRRALAEHAVWTPRREAIAAKIHDNYTFEGMAESFKGHIARVYGRTE